MNLVLSVLRQPESIRQLGPSEWDLLIRQCRHANLLGRLYERLRAAGLEAEIPDRPRNHLQSGAFMAEQQQFSIRREARFLREAQAVSRLHHENISKIFELGDEADVFELRVSGCVLLAACF